MRRLVFDQYEFEASHLEESFDIYIALKNPTEELPQFGDLLEFAAATGLQSPAELLGEALPYNDQAGFWSVRNYLKQFANITVPDPCNWRMYVVRKRGTWWDGFFESDDLYVRYHGFTTA